MSRDTTSRFVRAVITDRRANTRRVVVVVATVAVSLLCAASVYAAVISNQTLVMPNNSLGLVGHWTFDGKDMTRNVADTSGQGNTGYLTGFTSTTTTPGPIGQALNFDGVNDYVTNASVPAFALQTFTMSAWVRHNSDASRPNAIINLGTAAEAELYLEQNTGYLKFFANDLSPTFLTGSATLTDSKFHHVAVTKNGSTVTLYADGVQSGSSGTLTGTITYGDNIFDVGFDSFAGDDFQGSIDDTRIYNRVLSAAEVQQLYNLAVGTHQNVTINPPNLQRGLVGHWTFDGKDMIRNVADTSGKGNTGYLYNFTSTTTVPGVLGQALRFVEGTQQQVNVPSPSGLSTGSSTPWSLAAWVKPTSRDLDADYHMILIYGNTGLGDGPAISIHNSGVWNAGTSGYNVLGPTVKPGIWTYVVGTADSSNKARLYINGALVAGPTVLGENHPTNSQLNIGLSTDGANYGFDGPIDDARIYNRALSAAEVTQLYNQAVGTHQNTTLNPPNLQRGLVGHWTFDGKDMIRNVADTSGQGNTGNLVGATTTTAGVLGQALKFDGTSNSVSIADASNLRLASGGTISAWIKPTSFGGGLRGRILDKTSDLNGASGYDFYLNNIVNIGNGLSTNIVDVNSFYYSNSNTITLGVWQHVVLTIGSGGAVTFYVNGVNVTNTGAGNTTMPPDVANAATIGARTGASDRSFDGSIDDVRVYNRALSPAEVKQLYNLGH